jgi:hypothetical protein
VADVEPPEDEFKHTHYYNPIGWDRFDPRPHPGSSAIAPGSPVQRLGAMGPGKGGGKLAFQHVRDASGNHQSVARGSLSSKKAFETKMAQEREQLSRPVERLGYGPYHKHLEEEAEAYHQQYFPGFFNDRRNEGRRDRPT